MSAPIIVTTAEQLAAIVDAAVCKALERCRGIGAPDAWISIRATGLPPASVRRLIKEGALRAAKVGRETRVSSRDVQQYMEGAAAPKSEPAGVVELAAIEDPFEAARARARTRRSA